ncbi:MAG: GGDEF domain-containing protein [Gammaproteobacteria bacterium]|jgi:diguanylate cyclase (GGDEF)-like protein|nr:GGDEF domain-containing protein [Gammaproteobacteria bacterium]
MQQVANHQDSLVYDKEELKGFARSMAELQWLLLILVILYFFIPTRPITNSDSLIITMVSYFAFVIVFRYLNFQARDSHWKLAVETWAMIAFISTVLSYTGLVESPLLNLYLLVIIACAITLGKIMTLLEVMLIACCYLYMAYRSYPDSLFVPETFTMLMAKFSPFLLVAYVTSMLASDILYAKRRITLLSKTDDLTGLLNMRAFNNLLEREIARVTRHAQPFTVIMVDVDDLKSVNDRFGHTAGSRLIKTVAQSINESIRNTDILARYGGDEFVILMTHTSTEHARTAAERIRAAIQNTSFDMKGNRISTTVSVGIASFPESVETAAEVLDKADIALYRSKQCGRDRVTYYDRRLETVSACA